MNPLEEQTEILNQLAQSIFDQVDDPYDLLTCEYEYVERYDTISSSLVMNCRGVDSYPDTKLGFATNNLELCLLLRKIMKDHTGGEWISFTLSLDKYGNAKSKFTYA